jgi:DNA invertase Pin-like site-specific DNA recombinase
VPEARAIGDSLAEGGVRLSIGGTVYDPNDPMGKMFFNILATFAEFEVDLLRMRTREGMALARANGKLKGKPPKLSTRQRIHVLHLAHTGEHTIAELAELFSVSRAAIYREIARPARPDRPPPDRQANSRISTRALGAPKHETAILLAASADPSACETAGDRLTWLVIVARGRVDRPGEVLEKQA